MSHSLVMNGVGEIPVQVITASVYIYYIYILVMYSSEYHASVLPPLLAPGSLAAACVRTCMSVYGAAAAAAAAVKLLLLLL